MPLKVNEKDLQKGILDYLRSLKYEAFKFPSVGIYRKATDSYIRQPKRGISDIIACSPVGQFVAIEVKTKGNNASPEQLEFLNEIRKRGGIAILAYSLDDVIKALDDKNHNKIHG